MSKYLLGGLAAILALSIGLFWWQSNANTPLAIPNDPLPEPELIDVWTL